MYRFLVLFKRDLVNLFINPVFLPYNTIFPVIMVLVLGLLVRSTYGSVVTSYDYYGVTIMVYMGLNISVIATNSFMEKSLKDTNLRVMYTPIRIWYIYAAKILATFVFAVVCFSAVMVALHYWPGVNFGGENAIYVALLLAALSFFSCSLGVLFCCIFRSEELSNKILTFVNLAFALLGGVFFQPDSLGPTVVALSYASPARWVSQSAFRIIYDADFTGFLAIVCGLLVMGIGLTLLCAYFFRTEDYV